MTCLIQGASGTGKEHLARFIHQQSNRKDRPFVAVNCSALGDSLLESRLFGYEKGAFTGAEKKTDGFFEAARGGTLLLDEIGDISPYLQQTLLRVIQEQEFTPVGMTKPRKTDVRVIAATHRSLRQACQAGFFRWDLFYRLSVAELHLPSLCERGLSEKRDLIDFFAKKAESFRQPENADNGFEWQMHEKELIKRALTYYNGNKARACEALGYGSINTLIKKINAYDLI